MKGSFKVQSINFFVTGNEAMFKEKKKTTFVFFLTLSFWVLSFQIHKIQYLTGDQDWR